MKFYNFYRYNLFFAFFISGMFELKKKKKFYNLDNARCINFI